MSSKEKNILFEKYMQIKKESRATFYDTHIHPVEVLGVHNACCNHNAIHFLQPSLLEKLKYNNFSLKLLHFLFKKTPAYIRNEIRKNYVHGSLRKELDRAEIDTAVLVPIYPHANPEQVFKHSQNSNSIMLGSVNLETSVEEIKKDLFLQISAFYIKGIKLHPNIQKFYPEPSLNGTSTQEKLLTVYQIAKENKLYLLFHGGISFIPNGKVFEKREFARISNFFANKKSFLENIGIPVVIAHLGIYNCQERAILEEVQKLFQFPNVYFDTAGINPAHIYEFLKRFGADRIVFGSDALYFNIKYNLILLLEVLWKYSPTDFKDNVLKICSANYKHKILQQM